MKHLRIFSLLAVLALVSCPVAFGQENEIVTLNKIQEDTNNILENTTPRALQKGGWGTAGDILALVASASAIFAIGGAVVAYFRRRRTKKCQARALEDLIRYAYTTDVIIEVLRIKMEARHWEAVPNATIIDRFAFMDQDLKVSNYTTRAKNFNYFHEFCLFLRNYNSMVESVSSHFQDIKMDPEIKKRDLAELQFRSARIMARIYGIAKDMHLYVRPVDEILSKTYTSKPEKKGTCANFPVVPVPRFLKDRILNEINKKDDKNAMAILSQYLDGDYFSFYKKFESDYTYDVFYRWNRTYDIVLFPLDEMELARMPGMDLVEPVS